ncbi:YcjF family protein [Methylomicrobium lacus]|uniref:YcjF family protein n=1 Tax=Methylomicrobium lacus TaxID=136992 RepID=UPI0035A8C819
MSKLTTLFSDWKLWKKWNLQAKHPFLNLQDYTGKILNPTVDREAEQAINSIHASVPPPVFWLLGKTQSGKSAIIQTLTHATAAEVGNGFKPCTKTAMFFDYPDAETAFLRFLDTRGLSETGYDAGADMAWSEQQAHLLLVVVKAMDQQLEALLAAVKQIRKAHPNWPLIVAQTTLHEGYPTRTMEHVTPYPFPAGQVGPEVPYDLRCSLLKQRERFAGLNARFVPIDFTLTEDAYEPADYGSDELWTAIEVALPLGLREMLDVSRINDVYSKAAHAHIVSYAILAGCAAAIPLPVASLSSVVILQGKMFHSIASVYGLPLTRQSVGEIVSAIGLGVLSGMGGRELLKLVPYYGQTLAAGMAGLYTAAVSYGLGKTLGFYFAETRQGKALSAEALNAMFKQEFMRGGELLRDAIKRKQTPAP